VSDLKIENFNWQKGKNGNLFFIKDGYVVGLDCKLKEFYFDFNDWDLVKKYSWSVDNKGYVISNTGVRMHRLIMNPSNNMVVHHISRVTYDNRKSQLRICTPKENTRNSILPSICKNRCINKNLEPKFSNKTMVHNYGLIRNV